MLIDPSFQENGFSLIEVMVAMGIGTAFLLFLAQTLVTNSMSANSTRMDTDFNNLMSQIQLALANPQNCTPALYDNATSALIQPNPATTTYNLQKIELNGTAIATINQPAVGNQVTLLTLTNPTAQGGGPCAGNICIWTLNLGVTKTQAAGQTTFLGNTQTYRHFMIQVTTNGGSPDWTVTACSGSAVGSDSLWSANGSSVYYNGGNVGIGTATPSGILDVEGGTAAAATNGSNISIIAQNGGSGNQDGGIINLSAGMASGTGSPGGITLATVSNPSGNTNGLTVQNYSNGAIGYNVAASVYIASSRGNGAGGTAAVQSGDGLGYVDFQGDFDAIWGHGTGAYLYSQATANFTNTSTPAYLAIGTTPVNNIFPIERMRIDQNGNVGIGTTAPTYLLHVNGTAYATGAAGSLSDVRHKKVIQDLPPETLEQVLKLRPVSFEWKDPKDDGMKGKQVGLIAQEVQKVFPSAVLVQDNQEKTLGLKYNEIIALVAKALQELHSLVTRKFAALSDRLAALEARVPLRAPAATDEPTAEKLKKLERENIALQAESTALKAKSEVQEKELKELTRTVCELRPSAQVCRGP